MKEKGKKKTLRTFYVQSKKGSGVGDPNNKREYIKNRQTERSEVRPKKRQARISLRGNLDYSLDG